MNDLITSFTANLRRVLSHAAQLAASQGKPSIEPVHLFCGLTNQAEAQVTGFSLNRSKEKKLKIPRSLALSPTSRQILLKAATLADAYHHPYIGTEHLFLSLLESDNMAIRKMVRNSKLDRVKIRQELDSILQSSSKVLDLLDTLVPVDHRGAAHSHDHDHDHGQKERGGKQKTMTALEFFGTDLTQESVARALDPVIGRDQETNRLMQILSRRTKNNPVLIGPPGVGKTAIVEGLAKRINGGNVPFPLRGKKIISLNLTTILSGSAFRGELEMRVGQLLDEVRNDPSVIVFIDEIHTLVGAGGGNGSMDIANIFKPALARGELRCIGATTPQEYKRSIEEDPALERRFQPVNVEQPTVEESIRILTGLMRVHESFHGVTIAPEAIHAAVTLSERYITDKFLPDKAIDLLDEACARAKLSSDVPEQSHAIVKLESQIAAVAREKEFQLYQEKDLGKAQKLHNEEQDLKALLGDLTARPSPRVTHEHIAEIVSTASGISARVLAGSERTRLRELESRLSERVVGHAAAKSDIANAIRRAKAGLTRRGKPTASFFFAGPSGVGKTELAKTVAYELFGINGFVKLDMSEFSESFTVSRLIGSPSGYIGYKEGGRLTESVRQRPSSLILFDEVEKAHPKVLNLLLQILDEGSLSDSAGKAVDFSNTVIILASNALSHALNLRKPLGFDESANDKTPVRNDALRKELATMFAPELLNRLSAIVRFSPLSEQEVKTIIARRLKDLAERMAEQGISCIFKKNIDDAIYKTWYTAEQGARSISHAFEHEIESRLAEKLLASDTQSASLTVGIKNGSLTIAP